MSLPANWVAGQQFTAANENSVEAAANASTTTLAAATATPTASVLAQFDANKNLSGNNVFEGFTTTATAAGTTALTIASTAVQVFTGTTTQTVTLPTTSVPAGGTYQVINNSTGLVTVQSSGSNTVGILAAGTSGIFTALVVTPTTAANWNYISIGRTEQPGFTTTATAAGSTTLTVTSSAVQVFTGTTTQTVLLPTTSISAGATYKVINQSTGAVTVQSSGTNTVAVLAAATSGWFTAVVATPTTAANWSYIELGTLQQPGFTTTATAAGTTTLTATSTAIQVFTGSTTQTVALPTTGVPAGASYTIINQSSGIVTVQSSGLNTILALAGSAAAPFSECTFVAVVATPTTAANWDSSMQGAANAVLGIPTSGTLTNCTGLPWQSLTGGTTLGATSVTASSALTTAIATYEYLASTAAVGSSLGINAFGTSTSTVSASITWLVYVGTASGTTGTLVASANAGIAATNGASSCQGALVIRATGQGNCFASMTANGSAVSQASVSTQTATAAVTTTTNLFVTLAAGVAAGTSGFIVQSAFLAPGP